MAVVVSNGPTNISTVNGFYRCESSNLHFSSVGNVTTTTTPQHLSVTFANAGNIKGIGLGITSISAGNNRGMRINLAENVGNPTISIASPAVITKVAHGLNDLDEVFFDTTGALPTGITKKTVRYYVRNKTADTFNISTTPTGSLVNTSGSQSGTHTIWAVKVSQSYTWDEILTRTVNNDSAYVGLIVPFEFSSTYAVDTNADKWRFIFWQEGGTTGSYYFMVSNGAISENFSHFAWCDNAVSFTNDDVLIVKDIVTIDASFSIKGVLGTGNTVYSTAGIICRSLDTTEPGIYKLRWEQSPSASYTMTINGGLQLSSHAGFKIGDASNVIPASNKAIVNFVGPASVGTDVSCIRQVFYSSTARPQGKHAISFFGEIPTHRYGILASDANTSQNKIVLTEDLSSEWSVGDVLVIGKTNSNGQADVNTYTISSFNGPEITLTGNIAYVRKAGGTVINLSRGYGIEMSNTSASISAYIYSAGLIHHKVSGCKFKNVYETGSLYTTTQQYGNANTTKGYLCDNLGYATYNAGISLFASPVIPVQGSDIKRNLCYRINIVAYVGAVYATIFKSGLMTVEDNRILQNYSANAGSITSTNYKAKWINNVWENSYYAVLLIVGLNTEVTGNTFWGGSSTQPMVMFGTFCNSPRFLNNTFNRCFYAMGYTTGSFVIEGQSKNDSFGQESANNADFYLTAGVLCDFAIISPTGTINFAQLTLLPETLNGFKLRIVDENDIANVDKMLLTEGYYVRCGDGLADTTVHTTGSGKFSLRLEPLNEALKWEQYIPTGNIQNKSMSVLAWVKLNSTNYWAGTHVMPKLIVDYDDGTIASATASQSTEWQLLSIPITPLTTTGRIKVTLQIESDASGADSYVYFDDMAILYPAGHQLDLGGLDLWAGAEPITPTIATNISAADIWAYPTASLTASGTTGKQQKDLLTTGKFIALK
jgi:hypothetical protein